MAAVSMRWPRIARLVEHEAERLSPGSDDLKRRCGLQSLERGGVALAIVDTAGGFSAATTAAIRAKFNQTA
jgi:acyl-coenzyme A thioesterase PaaI-like protein